MLSVRMIDWTVRTECVCWFVKWMARLCDPMEHLTWMQTNKQTNNSQWTSTSCGFIDWMKEVNIIRVKWTPHRLPVTNPLSTSTHTHTHTLPITIPTHFSLIHITPHRFAWNTRHSSSTWQFKHNVQPHRHKRSASVHRSVLHNHTPAHTCTHTQSLTLQTDVDEWSTLQPTIPTMCHVSTRLSPHLHCLHIHTHTPTHTCSHKHTDTLYYNQAITHKPTQTHTYTHSLTHRLLLIPETHLKCTHNWCAMHSCSHDHQ